MSSITSSVVLDWQLSSYFGWGINGLHFLLNWSLQQRELLLTTVPVNESVIELNPIEWALIRPALEQSRELQGRLEPFRGQYAKINFPVLHALGDDLVGSDSRPNEVKLCGTPSIALAVFASTAISTQHHERAKRYPIIIVASNWNRMVLEQAGIGPTALAPEGVDPTAFHPAPKAGIFRGRFTVFSGGKLEYRKGHDLVLKAFRVFAQRHSDALLVTAWSSPWPDAARSLNGDPTLVPIGFRPDGQPDTLGWAVANGISEDQIIAIGSLPNTAMPRVYREMDVALFANRCEPGTNMVPMECMACGVPVILSGNTGHLDLIAPDRCFVLGQQAPIAGDDHVGWGESDVEEMLEALETVRADREGSLTRGARAAEFMRTRTWADTTRRRAEVIVSFM